MKANELMAGNIVQVNHYEYGDMYASVISVNDCGDLCLHLLDERFTKEEYECTMNEVCPIPITEELLRINGFKHDYDSLCELHIYSRECGDYYLSLQFGCSNMGDEWTVCHIDNCDRCSVCNADVRYVHQLQNLLNIYNIEMEIRL